ncbi:MAG: D-alanine--D-alanine ligase [Candidatus Euphemobacter frigidus]|nr:D-alanine--D-alanine ligase [Candidatus Euphemobacter frigidus]MDP8275872.1 D-alanine--D-alanine ligase [Candidatus Euphemobacter frigidus]
MINPKKYGTVGVLLGGPSAERAISLKSGKAISRALRKHGITVIEIGENEEIRAGIREHPIDVAFIALHGRFGEDGQVQELLEEMDIPYTGSGIEASRLAMDKAASRRIFEAAGLTVPPFRVFGPGDVCRLPPFSLPVVVKPVREGSSIGLSVVRTRRQFAEACTAARRYDRTILVGKYIPGKELTVGVLDREPLPVIEIIPWNQFFDYEAKYVKGKSSFKVPAPLPSSVGRKVQEVGLTAHRVLGCYAYSRADIILGDDGIPYLLEVNSIPGFTATSLLPQAARSIGIDFPALCLRLLDLALTRGNYRNHGGVP